MNFNVTNTKRSLVPFINGVYNLHEKLFLEHTAPAAPVKPPTSALPQAACVKQTTVDASNTNLTSVEAGANCISLIQYKYDPSVNNPDVWKFLDSILPNKSMQHYLLVTCASALNGNLCRSACTVLTGIGANGKTAFIKLLMLTFDIFSVELKHTEFNDNVNYILMKIKNKRFCSVDEIKDFNQFNILIKNLTDDNIPNENKLRTRFVLVSNVKPNRREFRCKVTEFRQVFVKEPIKDNEHLIDITLYDRMQNDITWRQTMMNILIEHYGKDVILHAALV